MVKASPQHLSSGSIASATPDKTAKLRDPRDGLAKRRWLSRGLRHAMNGTIERLPFIGLQQHTTGSLRDCPRQHGDVQNPPCHHTIDRQTTPQALGRLELTGFNAAATFQNPMPDLNVPLRRPLYTQAVRRFLR